MAKLLGGTTIEGLLTVDADIQTDEGDVILDSSTNTLTLGVLPTGSGNGLDADSVDGDHASAFLHVSGDAMSGVLDLSSNDLEDGTATIWDASASHIPQARFENDAVTVNAGNQLTGGGTVSLGGTITIDLNEGSNSGLDADLLDGYDSGHFAVSGHNHDSAYILESGDTMGGILTLSDGSTAASQSWVNNNADVPNADHADNADNATNAGDADTVDGYHATDLNRSRSYASLSSTDTTTDINQSTWTPIPWDVQKNLDGNYTHDASNSPTQITFDEAGTYQVYVNLAYYSDGNSIRESPGVSFAINGTVRDAIGKGGYIRNGSGHDEASTSLLETISVSAGDTLTVETEQRGSSGVVTLMANESVLEIVSLSEYVETTTDADTLDGYHASAFLQTTGGTLTGELKADAGMRVTRGGLDDNNSIESTGDWLGLDSGAGGSGVLLGYYNAPEVRVGNGNLTDFNWNGDTIATRPWVTGGNIAAADLGFDPATQSELDSHSGTNSAHHSRYSNEEAQDAVGSILDTDFNYDDAGNTISLSGTIGVSITGDADTVDGSHASAFADSGHAHAHSEITSVGSSDHHSRYSDSEARTAVENGDVSHVSFANIEDISVGQIGRDNSIGFLASWGSNGTGVLWDSYNVNAGNQISISGGTGAESNPTIAVNESGLDADTVDGSHASDFVHVAGDTMSGALDMGANNINLDNNSLTGELVSFDGSDSTGLRLENSNGYISLTPLNSSWAHIYTDRNKFIFNQPVYTTANEFSSYNADLVLSDRDTGNSITLGATADVSTELYETGSRVATRSWTNANADVPNADYADSAGDADTLDGSHASDLGSDVSDSGTLIVSNATDINFGSNIDVTDDTDGTVTVDGTPGYTDSDAISAINNDTDHGSTAQHNYFGGSHGDLSGIGASDHHAKYTDSEAVTAVNAETSLSVDITGDADTVDGSHANAFADSNHGHAHSDLSNIGPSDHHEKTPQEITYVQATEPSTPSSGEDWYETDTGLYRVYADRGDGLRWHTVTPVSVTDEAVTFGESDVTVSHINTTITNGSIELGFSNTSTATRTADDDNVTDNEAKGVNINPNVDLDGIEVTVSSNVSGASNVLITDTNSNILAEESGSYEGGETVFLEVSLSANTDYYVGCRNGTSNFTAGLYGSASYPYTSTDIDIVDGVYGFHPNDDGASTFSTYAYTIKDVTAVVANTSGYAFVEWDSDVPKDIDSWDLATFQRTLDGETVDVYVSESNDGGSTWTDINSGNPIPQNFDISDVDPANLVRIRGELARASTQNNPTVDYVARRSIR